jgi:membrane protease YdiL (CAAX protease family)
VETAAPLTVASPDEPSRLGRWLFAVTLVISYLPMQIVFALPAVGYYLLSHPIRSTADLQTLLESDYVVWASLIAAALAALLTICVALVWPWVWAIFTRRHISLREWLAWRKPERFPLWSVPLLTVPIVVLLGLVAVLVGPAEVEVQLELFRTPALQIASTLVVSSIVPVAEEFIFRGALYSAILPREVPDREDWQRQILPFALTTLLFAAVHLLSGFQTWAAILQIALLSAFLTGLRMLTGSVKPGLLAHLLWNLTAAIGLIASTIPT